MSRQRGGRSEREPEREREPEPEPDIEIDHPPVADRAIDAILSSCVINPSPEYA